jgi:hypothetical protein
MHMLQHPPKEYYQFTCQARYCQLNVHAVRSDGVKACPELTAPAPPHGTPTPVRCSRQCTPSNTVPSPVLILALAETGWRNWLVGRCTRCLQHVCALDGHQLVGATQKVLPRAHGSELLLQVVAAGAAGGGLLLDVVVAHLGARRLLPPLLQGAQCRPLHATTTRRSASIAAALLAAAAAAAAAAATESSSTMLLWPPSYTMPLPQSISAEQQQIRQRDRQ